MSKRQAMTEEDRELVARARVEINVWVGVVNTLREAGMLPSGYSLERRSPDGMRVDRYVAVPLDGNVTTGGL